MKEGVAEVCSRTQKENWVRFVMIFFGFLFLVGLGFSVSPTVNSVVLNSTNVSNNNSFQDLTGYINLSNTDGNNVSYFLNWYRNGVVARTTLIENGLVAYFPFDNDYYDYWGGHGGGVEYYNVTINRTFGKYFGSLALDGDSDYLEYPDIKLNNSFSIGFWFKTNDTKAYQYVIDSATSGDYQGYKIYIIGGGMLRFNINVSDGLGDFRCDFPVGFNPNDWHYGFVSYNKTSETPHLYFDGAELSCIIYSSGSVGGVINKTLIGGFPTSASASFDGNIDDLAIYNRTLSFEEMRKIYSLGSSEYLKTSFSDTSSGDAWVLGVRAADNQSVSSEANSSSISIGEGLNFSASTESNFINGVFNVSLKDDYSNTPSYSLVDINNTIAWWFPFNSSVNVGSYNNFSNGVTSYPSGVTLIKDPYEGLGVNLTSTFGHGYYTIHDWGYDLPSSFYKNQEFTISAWTILNNYSNTVVGHHQTDTDNLFLIGHGSNLSLSGSCGGFGIYTIRSSACYGIELDKNITLNKWVMLTMVYSKGTVKAYVNGVLVGTSGGISNYTNSFSFIGSQGYPSARMWIGNYGNQLGSFPSALGDFVFVQRAMSSSEVSSLYNSTDSNLDFQAWDKDWTAGENITLKGYSILQGNLFSTGERTLNINSTLDINLDFLRDNIVIQRNLTTNKATIILKGNYSKSYKGDIVYSINGVDYSDLQFGNGTFFKNISLGIGRYNFSVFLKDYPEVKDSVFAVGVGDVIVVTGQSNARLGYSHLSSYYTQQSNYDSSYSGVDAYNGVFWTYFPNYNVGSSGNQWFPMIDQVSYTQHVPVMMISAVIGGSTVSCWANLSGLGGGQPQCYTGLLTQLGNLTYNNRVYGVVYYQGEQDASTINYKNVLNVFLGNLLKDVNISSKKVIVGNPWSNSIVPFYPQKAIQEIWRENVSEGIAIGAYVYDMNTTELSGTVHFAEISNEGYPFIMRWAASALSNFYGEGDMKIPKLRAVYVVNSTRIDMVYDRALTVSDFLNNSGNVAWGLQLYNSSIGDFDRTSRWNMGDVSSTALNNNTVSYIFTKNISNAVEYSYCINTYCNNKTVVRDATSVYPSAYPPLMVYPSKINVSLEYNCNTLGRFWYSGSCYPNQLSACESKGLTPDGSSCVAEVGANAAGGFPVYYLNQAELRRGYRKLLRENYKVRFNVGNQSHSLNIDGIFNKTVTMTVSSEPQTFNLSIGEIKKINLDNDSYFDLEVSLSNITGFSLWRKANVTIKTIHERVPKTVADDYTGKNKEVVNKKVVGNVPEGRDSWLWITLGIVGLFALLAFLYNKLLKNGKRR